MEDAGLSTPSNPRKKKSSALACPPADDSAFLDVETYHCHLKELGNELAKANPRKEVTLDLMHVTFFNRREYILEEADSVEEILEKFPLLSSPEVVRQFYRLLYLLWLIYLCTN